MFPDLYEQPYHQALASPSQMSHSILFSKMQFLWERKNTDGLMVTGSLLLNCGPNMTDSALRSAHPSTADIFRLWQIFLENVHPLTHLIHAPTTQHRLLNSLQHLDENSKEWDTMLFAIYLAAIQSMPAKDVQDTFAEGKGTLLRKYQVAMRTALIRANFMNTNDILVVQAYVLYLVCSCSSLPLSRFSHLILCRSRCAYIRNKAPYGSSRVRPSAYVNDLVYIEMAPLWASPLLTRRCGEGFGGAL